MALIRELHPDDYLPAFNLMCQEETYLIHDFDDFCATMDKRAGFTVWDNDRNLLSMLSYDEFIKGNSVTIHFLYNSKIKGGFTKEVVKTAFRFPFFILRVPRVVTYSISGLTDSTEKFFVRLGFRLEGIFKEAARLIDEPRDLKLYGMLKRECRWL